MISYFNPSVTREGKAVPGVRPNGDLSYEDFFAGIRDGRWQDEVLQYRAGRREKLSVPGVTPSGTFTYRAAGNLIQHSGVICLDFDAKDNDTFPADEIAADTYTYAMHRSISGAGWCVYVKIEPARHADAYLALEAYFANKYHVLSDPAAKDVPRFRFVSYDPEIYVNPASRQWRRYIPKKDVMPAGKTYVYTRNDVEHVINQITSRGVNLAEDYDPWLKIGFALAHEFGEAGREYFHAISSTSIKYDRDKCDAKYSQVLKKNNGRCTIATLFWLASRAGLEIKTQKTTHIERVAKMQLKVAGKAGGAINKDEAAKAAERILTEIDGIEGPEIEQIINQVKELPAEALNGEKTEDLVADLKEFLRTYSFKFNEVTRRIEMEDGAPITDRDINSIYIKAMEILGNTRGKGVTKDLIMSIIDSDFTPAYNPFLRFFADHSNLKPRGEVEKLISCLKIQDMELADGRKMDGSSYAQLFVKKWLLGCVASWHGTHSVLMLVLIGKQNKQKTKFFRNLLPDELSAYYAESQLDEGKDSEILMCQKGLICDDEYEGKNKADFRKLKALLSKQHFSVRKPYGRTTEDLQRIAVLCGTSNEEKIINDPTGNRRIIPVMIHDIDMKKFERIDKTALWMELYREWKRVGDGWMLTPTEVEALNRATVQNNEISAEEEALLSYFSIPGDGEMIEFLTNTEIKIHLELHSRGRYSARMLGLALAKCGFQRKSIKKSGVSMYAWGVKKVAYLTTGPD